MKTKWIGVILFCFTVLAILAFIVYSLLMATKAWGDDTITPTTTPTPGPVVNTGGANTGSSPGSSCSARLGLRNQPPTQSPTNLWATSGDSGWPFGWPGLPPYAPSTLLPANSVGCSR